MFATIAICKRIAMSKIDLVVFMLELDLKSESIVETAALLFEVILVVGNLMTISLPLLIHR